MGYFECSQIPILAAALRFMFFFPWGSIKMKYEFFHTLITCNF
jgi:hypothetical protein